MCRDCRRQKGAQGLSEEFAGSSWGGGHAILESYRCNAKTLENESFFVFESFGLQL